MIGEVAARRHQWHDEVAAALGPLGVVAATEPAGVRLRSRAGTGLAIVDIPGRWGTGCLWARDAPRRDLRARLAESGHDVLTVRLRPAARDGAADEGDEPDPALAAVRTRDLLDDISAAAALARDRLRGAPLVLCGYSIGASLAFLAAARVGADALVVLDGGLPAVAGFGRGDEAPHVENPGRHPRSDRQALRALRSDPDGTAAIDGDRVRWRLGHNRWWPAAPVDEIRRRSPAGLAVNERLRAFTGAILCVAATGREPLEGHRTVRTAEQTRATRIELHHAEGLSHEDVACGDDPAARALAGAVADFVATVRPARKGL